MYIVDSSVWIALFSETDSQREKAIAAMSAIGDAQIVVNYGVVLETVTVLERNQSKAHANKFVEYITVNNQVEILNASTQEDCAIYLREKDGLSFVDTLLKSIARQTRFILVTFDKRLLQSANAD